MNKSFSVAVLCALVFPCLSLAQEYSYTHYGIADGLAGATVFCITQDKEGFIWTGTETGVSRFDGTRFKNFTPSDGLPDLEILLLYCDSQDRVWMAPFRMAVCYYYQGKIHNQQNDTLLARIHLQNVLNGIAGDTAGNILLSEKNRLHLLLANGTVQDYDSLDGQVIETSDAVTAGPSGGFLVEVNGKVAEFSSKGFSRWLPGPGKHDYNHAPYIPYVTMSPAGAVWKVWPGGYEVRLFGKKDSISHAFPVKHFGLVNVALLDDSLVFTNELSGSYEYNLHSGQERHFLPGISVSRTFRDAAGDLWFTTIGEGIFKLNPSEFRIVPLATTSGEKQVVTAIQRIGDELWVGNSHSSIFRFSLPDLEASGVAAVPAPLARRILVMDPVKGGTVLVGGDEGLYACTNTGRQTRLMHTSVKAAMRIDDKQLFVAAYGGAYLLDIASLRTTDTLMFERATTVFGVGDTLYAGGLNGLYRWVGGGPRQFLGSTIPFLRNRIAAVTQSSDGILWVASADDDGIVGYRGDRPVASLTKASGLTSNICRTLLVHGDVLWVGTDKGLNRVDLGKPGYPVVQYTVLDGLVSDMINTVFVDGSRVYVGTPEGLCYFNERKTSKAEGCGLYLTALVNSERDRLGDTANLVIPYSDKRIRVEFAGISYRSGGDIRYRYRMLGLDDKWRETRDNFLEYPDLPSGTYEWQLVAVNKFGVASRVLRFPVIVTTQFWKRPWFLV
jgi:ligand-binding sensor domain-containing protein